MIDDPKLEKLLDKIRTAAKSKDDAVETLQRARSELPGFESKVNDWTNEYEAALYELTQYVKSQ